MQKHSEKNLQKEKREQCKVFKEMVIHII